MVSSDNALWNATAPIPDSLDAPGKPVAAAPVPAVDAARMAALKRLRHTLIAECSKHGCSRPPVLCFERWMARVSLRQTDNAPTTDCLIPSDGIADEGFVQDLSRTMERTAAQEVAQVMAKEGKKAADKIQTIGRARTNNKSNTELADYSQQLKTLAKAVKKATKAARSSLCNDSDNSGDSSFIATSLHNLKSATGALEMCVTNTQRATGAGEDIHVNGSRRPGIFDVCLLNEDGNPKKPYLPISAGHLQKLLDLWILQHNNVGDDDALANSKPKQTSTTKDDPMKSIQSLSSAVRNRFLQTLYCLLARYEGLKGAGYQCAVPGSAFEAAASLCGLGTTIECFASPLNCRYRRFCSAFPDLETSFGSLGSFFDDKAFFPLEGSFEANPPFVPETMTAMVQKIQRLLDNRLAGPLSFLVVVPAWGAGITYCETMEASNHYRAKARVLAADHAYCDGAQHQRVCRGNPKQRQHQASISQQALLRPSSWDTAVILLQNDEGAKTWSVTSQSLEESFCQALKEAGTGMAKDVATIQGWENRGVARGGSGASSNTKKQLGFPSSLSPASKRPRVSR